MPHAIGAHKALPSPPARAARRTVGSSPPLDFARLDTPRKAVQLPVLDPGFQLALALAVAAAGAPGAPPLSVSVETGSGGASIRIDLRSDREGRLIGWGVFEGRYASLHKLESHPGALLWEDRLVGWTGRLQAVSLDGAEGFQVSGWVGEVPALLAVKPLRDGAGRLVGLHTEGSLGELRYESHLAPSAAPGEGAPMRLRARGRLGSSEIDKRYRLSCRPGAAPGELAVDLEGEGTNAGYLQTVRVSIRSHGS